jgi:eukaryotic-like serine/threonine-protein kinase
VIKNDAAKKQPKHIDHSGDHASLPFGATLSHYRIVSLLGCGGMGDVYKAFDKSLNRFVALKVLPADLVSNRERLQRFAQEARSASALSHPNIVTVFEIGQGRIELNRDSTGVETSLLERDIDFIAMEYIEGESLRARIAQRLSLESALDLLSQVALGLSKAHAEGIIHRDLKPENIMVADDEYVKIIDFGLAKLIEHNGPLSGDRSNSPTAPAITHEGDIIGTAGYMSPEQVQGFTKQSLAQNRSPPEASSTHSTRSFTRTRPHFRT